MKKIAHFCEFADRSCGVFRAVLEIAKRQQEEGNHVIIFTTHFNKDYSINEKIVEEIEGIICYRIKAKKQGGEAFNKWDEYDFSWYDELWSHGYRKHHNLFLRKYNLRKRHDLFIGEYPRKVLVTHAPWGSDSIKRSIAIFIFDLLYKKSIEENFEIYHIAKWEEQYTVFPNDFKLIKIPLRKEFLTLPRQAKQENKALFVGRKEKIKPFLQNKTIEVDIVQDVFDVKELIKLYDSHKYSLHLNKREGLPTTLREAQARGCITIATRNKGTLEVGADHFLDYGDWDLIDCFLYEKLI